MQWFSKKRIYMDHAATTPIDRDVLSYMNELYRTHYYNPGGLYREGVTTAQLVDVSRKKVAELLDTTREHIIFTRGGTESNMIALMGVVEQFEKNNPHKIPHIIISAIEHPVVLETVQYLEQQQRISLSIISVDTSGVIMMDELKQSLCPETILVSVMYVNNEIGTIQPIKEITKLVRWYKKQQKNNTVYPLVHTDAIQAANYLDISVNRLGVDFMSLSGSKIYGPKSSGVVFVRDHKTLAPIFHGGNQEFGLRAGTEDVALIAGFTRALVITRTIADSESLRLTDLRNYFIESLKKDISGWKINGSLIERIPNNINLSLEGISSERLVIELDAQGISVSSKSACREGDDEESFVIAALRKHKKSCSTFRGSIRFTLGKSTTKKDIEKAVFELGNIVKKVRNFKDILPFSS